jgi:hypothetical protein
MIVSMVILFILVVKVVLVIMRPFNVEVEFLFNFCEC